LFEFVTIRRCPLHVFFSDLLVEIRFLAWNDVLERLLDVVFQLGHDLFPADLAGKPFSTLQARFPPLAISPSSSVSTILQIGRELLIHHRQFGVCFHLFYLHITVNHWSNYTIGFVAFVIVNIQVPNYTGTSAPRHPPSSFPSFFLTHSSCSAPPLQKAIADRRWTTPAAAARPGRTSRSRRPTSWRGR
jgi:hypothetical protein